MGFEVYLQWFEDGEPGSVSADAVRDAFGESLESDRSPDVWRVVVDGAEAGTLYADLAVRRVESLMIERPTATTILWRGLFELLRVDHGVLFGPGVSPAVASSLTAAHLPSEMVEALGPLTVVGDGLELMGHAEND